MSDNKHQHLAILHIATAGQNGLGLGSDEEEIVLIQVGLVDTGRRELLATFERTIQPQTFDVNENLLSEECKAEFSLSDDVIKASESLEVVLGELHSFLDPYSTVTLVCEGPLPLRQSLHPEACAKDLKLESYFWSFFDLGKELGKIGVEGGGELEWGAVAREMNIDGEEYSIITPAQTPAQPSAHPSAQTHLSASAHPTKFHHMTAIVLRLLRDGHVFTQLEFIQERLEPGICSRSEEIDPNTIVRARGLPWQSSDQDIARFFRGLDIAKGGVALCLSPQGRRNGEALIRFSCESHREMALRRHKHHIGQRYIEVYKATGEDFLAVAGGTNTEAQAFLIKGASVIVRMRGLPYDCTAKQVLDFFSSSPDSPLEVLDGEEGVLFVRRPDGRATGDAFVLFKNEEDAPIALAKHRESIGSRYIELFRSTTAEVQQVLNRCLELLPPKAADAGPSLPPLPPPPPPAAVVQHMITAGTRKDCIRLRGLPYEAQVEHILEFLGEHAKNIIYQGVHMVYNAQGQPSGEAFIQMDSEHSAFAAATSSHHRYMIYFKKHRYIEVFQCSGEDMSCVLTGGPKFPQMQNQAAQVQAASIQAAAIQAAAAAAAGVGVQVPQPPPLLQQNFYTPYQNRYFQQIFYYSPPMSPSYYPNFQHGHGHGHGHLLQQQQQQQQLELSHPLSINCGPPGGAGSGKTHHRFQQQQGGGPGEFPEKPQQGRIYQKNYLEMGLFMA